jgi:hypothetical protein
MHLLPQGGRQWIRLLLRLGIVILLLISTAAFFTSMPGHSYSGSIESLSDGELLVRDNIQRHVVTLASEIGERNIWHYQSLTAADEYIERSLNAEGYQVAHREI